MTLRRLKYLAIVLLASAVPQLPQTAAAQGMSFGEDDVEAVEETVDPSDPNLQVLAEGKALYEQGKFEEASLAFFKVTQSAGDLLRGEAEYELGKTLLKMELYQGALSYFGKIVDLGEMHPFFIPTLRGLVLLTDVMHEDAVLIERLAAYKDFLNDVPEKYRDRFSYLVGRHLYTQLEIDDALRLLGQVKPASDDFAKARYIAGVTHVADYDAEAAVDAFKDTLRVLMTKRDNSSLNEDETKLLHLANLGMARVFYSTGSVGTSLKFYSEVPRSSDLWATALFESSWAYFQVDQYNKALGNLHSLFSPFFRTEYFPEAPILSAVIFFYNCKYDRVRASLEEFAFTYEPMLAAVQNVLATKGDDPEGMFEWLLAVRDGAESPELRAVAESTIDDQQVRNKINLIRSIEQEIALLAEKPSTWKGSGLGSNLSQDANLAISFARGDAGGIVIQRLERVAREIQDYTLEQEKILFEVTRAERGEIEADLRNEMAVESNVTKPPRVKVSDEELYWTFEGEYWRDELGFYLFTVNSECKR